MAVDTPTTSRAPRLATPPPVTSSSGAPSARRLKVAVPRPPLRHFLVADLSGLIVASAAAYATHPRFALVAPVAIVIGLRMGDLYKATTAPTVLDELSRIVRGIGFAVLAAAAVTEVTTSFAAAYAVVGTASVTMARFGLYAYTRADASRHPRRVLIVGTGVDGQELADRLLSHPEYGLVPVGFVDDAPQPIDPTLPITPVGGLEELPGLIARLGVDRIVIDLASVSEPDVLGVLDRAVRVGVEVTVLPVLAQHLSTEVRVEALAGTTLLTYRPSRHHGITWSIKRTIDVVGAGFLLLMLAPLLVTVTLAIRLTSPGPILFTQKRMGRFGREFTMFKFRTMVPDAEDRLADLMAQNEADGPYFKLVDDPRITPIGRVLRRLSLDEIPQLLNVVRGDMSLVGPRPALAREVAEYPEWFKRRLLVPPGLTGLWQVSGRYMLAFGEATRLDVYYVDHWSLGLDLKILARTPHTVFTGKGAA